MKGKKWKLPFQRNGNSQKKEKISELFLVFVKYIIAKPVVLLYNTGRYGSVLFAESEENPL